MLKTLFGSEARVRILTLFMLNSASEFYLREISQRTGLPVRAVERTVKSLFAIGLLQRERRGNSVYFCVNRNFAILPELQAIVLKTVGLGDRLREAFSEMGQVETAFVYGSYASNEQDLESDVDIFVIGSVLSRKLTPILSQLEKELGREINTVVFTSKELRQRLSDNGHFVRSVLSSPKVFLVGNEEALRSLVER